MQSRNYNRQTCEACCPNCDTWQRVDRDEDGAPDLNTQPCHADDCAKRLCEHCAQFRCIGCRLAHCAEHAIWLADGPWCPVCVAAMVEEGELLAQEV